MYSKSEPATFELMPVVLPRRWLHFESFPATIADLSQWHDARAQEQIVRA